MFYFFSNHTKDKAVKNTLFSYRKELIIIHPYIREVGYVN